MLNKINSLTHQSRTTASFDKGKEEVPISRKEAQAPVDRLLNADTLSLIFTYATKNGQDGKTFCAIRSVSKTWHNLSDAYNIKVWWGRLITEIQCPDLATNISSIEHSASSPMITDGSEGDESVSMEIDEFTTDQPAFFLDSTYFSRFVELTQNLREKGAPISDTSAVIGFDPLSYEEMHQRLDTALETIWTRIQNRINFEEAPIPANAKTIREWLNNPLNAEKIARITHLSLSKMNLTVLPPEIGKLSQLIELHLSENQITVLPPEIGKLSQLIALDLSKNQITALPPEIGNLSQLKRLYLKKNRITALSPEIGNLSQLTMLDFSENRITVLPTEIGNLSQLKALYLYKNQITALPPEIGKLSQLTKLYLCENQITAFPPEIGKLSLLEELLLSKNRLTTLPPEIGNLSQLIWFRPYGNLLIFILDKDFHQPNAHQNLNFRHMINKFAACSSYNCQTPLASLCQQIHFGKEEDLLRNTFETLSDEIQQRIRQAWAAIPSPSASSSETGADLFADRASCVQAIITAIQNNWQSLSEEQRNQVYLQVAILAGKQKEDVSWGKAHAEENIIRLIDAMELVTQK